MAKIHRRCDLTLYDFYKAYKKDNPKTKINRDIYRKFFKAFFTNMMKEILYNAGVVNLLGGLGSYGITTNYKKVHLNPTYPKHKITNLVGTLNKWKVDPTYKENKWFVYNKYRVTDYYRTYFTWKKDTAVTGIKLYGFKPIRKWNLIRNELTKQTIDINNNQEKYYWNESLARVPKFVHRP